MDMSDVETFGAPAQLPSDRRGALRSIAGLSAAGLALLGFSSGTVVAENTKEKQLLSGARKKKKKKKRGPTGPTGPAGPASGLTGPTGPEGATGPFSLAGLEVISRPGAPVNVNQGGANNGEAACEPGELLIGGGHDVATGGAMEFCFPTQQFISDDLEYVVIITCPAGTSASQVRAVAFCLRIS